MNSELILLLITWFVIVIFFATGGRISHPDEPDDKENK
jgi:hypothetical protein